MGSAGIEVGNLGLAGPHGTTFILVSRIDLSLQIRLDLNSITFLGHNQYL